MSGNVPANSSISPSFIEAKSAKELEDKMLLNNLQSRKQYHYTIVVMSNKFYAWYDKDHSQRIIKKARGVDNV